MDLASQLHERRLLVERANVLIEKHCLPVPRFFATRFINFEFWCAVFARIFRIKCDNSLRTPLERVEMMRSCLNTLASVIGQPLDHIRPESLLAFDVATMKNLIQIAELWDDSLEWEDESVNMDSFVHSRNSRVDDENTEPEVLAESSFRAASGRSASGKSHSNKSQELADMLYKSLKNQTLALEIEKKIKTYLGDVTVPQADSAHLRASRQSIVRTCGIQPTSTFDFNLHKMPKRNHVFSVDLEKLFPEISREVIGNIRLQEQRMFMTQRNIRLWNEGLALKRVNRSLNEVISKQRHRLDLSEKEVVEEDRAARAKRERARQIALKQSHRQVWADKAQLQTEIDKFYRESTAAYLNARSHLERILISEFSKVDAHKKQQINEIRKYLQNHYERETDNLRSLLENFDSM